MTPGQGTDPGCGPHPQRKLFLREHHTDPDWLVPFRKAVKVMEEKSRTRNGFRGKDTKESDSQAHLRPGTGCCVRGRERLEGTAW